MRSKTPTFPLTSHYSPLTIYALMLIKMQVYEKYLEIIDNYLRKFFEQQKDYIFCKEGCSICCESGTYPFSQLEFDYLQYGFSKLPDELKIQIIHEIKQLKEEKINAGDAKFFHKCPFLIDKKCSVYDYRALICRNYGLMYYYKNDKGEQRYHMPCCVSQGLNYSNVYDEKQGTLTTEKWEKTGIEAEPVSFNVSLDFLMENNLTEYLELKFGEQKHLLDWF